MGLAWQEVHRLLRSVATSHGRSAAAAPDSMEAGFLVKWLRYKGPGRPVACSCGLLCVNYGVPKGIVARDVGPPQLPAKDIQ